MAIVAIEAVVGEAQLAKGERRLASGGPTICIAPNSVELALPLAHMD